MNLIFNKKAITSIVLAGSIALSAHSCSGTIKTKDDDSKVNNITTIEEPVVENTNEYVGKRYQRLDLNILNNDKYHPIGEDNRYTVFYGSSIYFKDGWNITDELVTDNLFVVTAIETNDEFTLVTLPDGRMGYVANGALIKCANLQKTDYRTIENNKESSLTKNAYLYDSTGMYVGYVCENEPCSIVATNGEYSLITLANGTTGFVLSDSLMHNYIQINGSGYVKAGTPIYRDVNLTNMAYVVSEDTPIGVKYLSDMYACIYNDDYETLYMNPNDLLPNFIIVDLDAQTIECYLDYQLKHTWGTRTGKDSTPTHTGSFDIDWKAADWEFTTYPGSHAKYWIPINEYDEGIHDLVGDDEQNYGNEAYHSYGSHGCIRVPSEASEFVYDNYNVGDMVLVRKK